MSACAQILDVEYWNSQYQSQYLPWETNRPSSELSRMLHEYDVSPCRAIEFGCGTGTNSVWLAKRGFDVTGVDLSSTAIQRARLRATRSEAYVSFTRGDITALEKLEGPYEFFFDRGCYHAVRRADAKGYLRTARRLCRPGGHGLVLMGNADEPEDAIGPPVVTAEEIQEEWGRDFDILHLRPFRFEAPPGDGKRYLAWSCFMRRRP